MSEEENKAFMRRYYEQIDAAAKDKRGAAVLDDFIAPNFVNHDPPPGFTPDLEDLKQAYWPDPVDWSTRNESGGWGRQDLVLVPGVRRCGAYPVAGVSAGAGR